jgi:hypothetical protein
MKQYMTVAPDGRVDATYEAEDDAPAPLVEGFATVELSVSFPGFAGPTKTQALHWIDGAFEWVETAPLADAIARTLEQIDADADAARLAVLIKTTKAQEYTQAEAQAREWKASGFVGAAPPDVASWAAAKWRDGMTDQQAAEGILAQADQYRALLSGIRALRLAHMEDARHAAATDEAQASLDAFTSDLSSLMGEPA